MEDDVLCLGLSGREGQRFCFRSHCNTKAHVLKKFGLPAEGEGVYFTRTGAEEVARILPFVLKSSVPILFWSVFNKQHRQLEVWAASIALGDELVTGVSMWETDLENQKGMTPLKIPETATKIQ